MSDLPTQQEDHEAYQMPRASEDHQGTSLSPDWKSSVNRMSKSDMSEKSPAKGSDRYGGGDLPSGNYGDNETTFRVRRDD